VNVSRNRAALNLCIVTDSLRKRNETTRLSPDTSVILRPRISKNFYVELLLLLLLLFKPWYAVPRVGQKIKYKEIKLEWFLIRLVLNRKTVVQQDSVKALHDNRNIIIKCVRRGYVAGRGYLST